MKVEILNNLVSDAVNFNLGIFGISITIFTVLYSFILNKKDNLHQLNEEIKIGNEVSPEDIQRISFFVVSIKRWVKLNNHLRNIIILSFIGFISGLIVKYLIMPLVVSIIVLTMTLGVLSYSIIIFFFVFRNYSKSTSIV